MRRHLVRWILRGAGVVLVWLVLVEKTTLPELVAAVIVAALTVVVLDLVLDKVQLGFAVTRADLLIIARRLPARIAVGTLQVFAHLGSREPGAFREVAFDPGGDDAASVARRALVIAAGSVSPAAFVVDIYRERGTLLLHQLIADQAPPVANDREWPI